jgi:hypothetical protein
MRSARSQSAAAYSNSPATTAASTEAINVDTVEAGFEALTGSGTLFLKPPKNKKASP